jgi:Flp pilus assembly protein TadG
MRVRQHRKRHGKVLVLIVLMVPIFCGIAGLAIDGGILMLEARHAQNVADAAATAAATELRLGNSAEAAIAAANDEIAINNNMTRATISVDVPPATGPYAASSRYAEVRIRQPVDTHLIHVLSGRRTETAAVRATAGVENVTAGAAIIVLDPNPSQFSTSPVPLSAPLNLPSLVAGLEALGVGRINVNGAIHVNNQWGGVDENSQVVGSSAGPPYAVSTTPLLATSTLYCTDLRVVGGVDNPARYQNVQPGQPRPLHANRLPVEDPFKNLPVPTTSVDAANVSGTEYGGRTILTLPLITTTLNPGVYDYINVISGRVVFNPGVYIIRGTNSGQPALNLVAGEIHANGVMFYLTNTIAYAASDGLPDASDGETRPASPASGNLVPSAVINFGLTGSSFTPLSSPGSPFNGLLIYQRRQDRRPVMLVQESIINTGTINGAIYAKWGHVVLAGLGTYDARIVAGTMRLVAVLNLTISPSTLFPPAKDVFLVE